MSTGGFLSQINSTLVAFQKTSMEANRMLNLKLQNRTAQTKGGYYKGYILLSFAVYGWDIAPTC